MNLEKIQVAYNSYNANKNCKNAMAVGKLLKKAKDKYLLKDIYRIIGFSSGLGGQFLSLAKNEKLVKNFLTNSPNAKMSQVLSFVNGKTEAFSEVNESYIDDLTKLPIESLVRDAKECMNPHDEVVCVRVLDRFKLPRTTENFEWVRNFCEQNNLRWAKWNKATPSRSIKADTPANTTLLTEIVRMLRENPEMIVPTYNFLKEKL